MILIYKYYYNRTKIDLNITNYNNIQNIIKIINQKSDLNFLVIARLILTLASLYTTITTQNKIFLPYCIFLQRTKIHII